MERLATRHHTIHEGIVEGLREHFTETEVVELGLISGAFIMFGRLLRAFDVAPMDSHADFDGTHEPA